MSRTTFLVLCVLAAGGYWVADRWDEIRIALGVEEPTELRAVGIAKSAFCLRVDLPNATAIDTELDDTAGRDVEIERIGWSAYRCTETIYLARYDYRRNGEPRAYVFEVNVGSTAVRRIDQEPKLTAKYAQALAASTPPAAGPR